VAVVDQEFSLRISVCYRAAMASGKGQEHLSGGSSLYRLMAKSEGGISRRLKGEKPKAANTLTQRQRELVAARLNRSLRKARDAQRAAAWNVEIGSSSDSAEESERRMFEYLVATALCDEVTKQLQELKVKKIGG